METDIVEIARPDLRHINFGIYEVTTDMHILGRHVVRPAVITRDGVKYPEDWKDCPLGDQCPGWSCRASESLITEDATSDPQPPQP